MTARRGLPSNMCLAADGLIRWLATMFDRSSWQPEGVVVVGGDADLKAISLQLDDTLPVPVFTQSGAELALARGAAWRQLKAGALPTPGGRFDR